MDNSKELSDKIWITERSRIRAESRSKLNDLVAHLVTIWYSFWLIVWSLFQEPIKNSVKYYDQINTTFSVALLAMTLTLYGFKFGQRAEAYKKCYHQLQRLRGMLNSLNDVEKIYKEYIDTLEASPNHTNFDYQRLLFEQYWKKMPLKSPGTDTPRLPTWMEILILFYSFTWRFIWIALLFIFPFLFAYVVGLIKAPI